jgi:hypothetical protein
VYVSLLDFAFEAQAVFEGAELFDEFDAFEVVVADAGGDLSFL